MAGLALGCTSTGKDKPDASSTTQTSVETSSTEMKAPDYDQRPADGSHRPLKADGTQVLAASLPQSDFAGGVEWDFYDRTNAARQAIGVAGLVRDGNLDTYARNHARAMAEQGHIFHTDLNLLLNESYWWTVGENVGVGPDAARTQAAYEASPGHYGNLTSQSFGFVGVGVYVNAEGRVFSVLDFAS